MINSNKILEIISEFERNINSHSYIFYTNDFNSCKNDVTLLCKKLLNNNNLEIISNDFIDINSFDKKNILKEDLLTIKKRFLTKSYMNKYRIYLIEEAHKLNPSSANMILKFLEEPEEKIVGFFITTELDSVLSTIKSRCQIVNCYYENKVINNNDDYKIFDDIFSHQPCYNIYEFKKRYFEKIERNDLINLFNNYLNKCYNNHSKSLNECNKILIINNVITKLLNNVNIEYVFDYLILESSDI